MREFHFLLLPQFSFIGFASLVEPLRVANRFRPGSYHWRTLSLDGGPVLASNDMSLNVDAAFSDAPLTQLPHRPAPHHPAPAVLFVVASFHPLDGYSPALAAWLRSLDRLGVLLGSIDTGAFVLAEAGLLQGHKVTLHWEALAAFKERYAPLTVSSELFEITGQRLSCAGGTAGIDMTLALIAQDLGQEMAATISEQFVLGRIRSQSDQQRLALTTRYGVHNASVIAAIRLMQNNLEDPLPSDALAQRIHLSRRQMERLFQTHLATTPAHFYLRLRLQRAQELVQQSDLSILAIGVACGFKSASHLSRAYRALFGSSPQTSRSQRHGSSKIEPPTGHQP
jgi:AraC family transcriptional regulator, carnitine catabolism transcriptional activator